MNTKHIGAGVLLILAFEAQAQQCDAGLTSTRFLDQHGAPSMNIRMPKESHFFRVEVTSSVPRAKAMVWARAKDGPPLNLKSSTAAIPASSDPGGSSVQIFAVDIPREKLVEGSGYSHEYSASFLTDGCTYPIAGMIYIDF